MQTYSTITKDHAPLESTVNFVIDLSAGYFLTESFSTFHFKHHQTPCFVQLMSLKPKNIQFTVSFTGRKRYHYWNDTKKSVTQLMLLSFSVLWNVKSPAPTEGLLSHRKHCPLNASSVLLPLIPWLCDITLRQEVTHLHDLCLATSLAQLLCCCSLYWLRRVLADQSEETGS